MTRIVGTRLFLMAKLLRVFDWQPGYFRMQTRCACANMRVCRFLVLSRSRLVPAEPMAFFQAPVVWQPALIRYKPSLAIEDHLRSFETHEENT